MPPLLPLALKRRRAARERILVVVEALTVGLPFCAFKALAGGVLWHHGLVLQILAGILFALAAVDALLNGLNTIAVAATGRRWLPVCSLQALLLWVRPNHRSAEIGTALDVMLSFTLVAGMLGLGGIHRLSPDLGHIWNLSVILNVLGAGALRFAEAVAPAKSAPLG